MPTLWAQGKVHAAIEREHHWNELTKMYRIEIRCGCVMTTGDPEKSKETIERISAEHSEAHYF